MLKIQLNSRHYKSTISPGKNRLFAAINNKANNYCFDCGKDNPEYISINNGIFICKNCADYHLLYLKKQSKIIINDLNILNNNELKYLYYGGNYKLKEFIKKEYPLLLKIPPNQIYMTLALDYYRQKLKFLIEGGKAPDKPKNNIGFLNINENDNFSLNNKTEENYNNDNNSIEYINLTFNKSYNISSSLKSNNITYINNKITEDKNNYNDDYIRYKNNNDMSRKKDYNKESKKLTKSKSGEITSEVGNLLKRKYLLNYKRYKTEKVKKRKSYNILKGVYSRPRLISKLIMRNSMRKIDSLNQIKTINYSLDILKAGYPYPMISNYFNNIYKNINTITNNDYYLNLEAPYKDNIFLYNHIISKSNDDFDLNKNKYINNNIIKNINNDIKNINANNRLKCLKIVVPRITQKCENEDINTQNINNNNSEFSSSEIKYKQNGKIQELEINKKIIIPKIIKYNSKEELNKISSNNTCLNYNKNKILEKRTPVKINLNIYKEPKFYVSIHQDKKSRTMQENKELKKSNINKKEIKNDIKIKDINKNNKVNKKSLNIKKQENQSKKTINDKNLKNTENTKKDIKKIIISNRNNNIFNIITRYTEKSLSPKSKKENDTKNSYINNLKKYYCKYLDKSPDIKNKKVKLLNKNKEIKDKNGKNENSKKKKNINNKKQNLSNNIDLKDKKNKNIFTDKKSSVNNSFFYNKKNISNHKSILNLKKIKLRNTSYNNSSYTNKNISTTFLDKNKYQSSSSKNKNQIFKTFKKNNNKYNKSKYKNKIGISQKQLTIKNLFLNNTTIDIENEKHKDEKKPRSSLPKYWTSTCSKRLSHSSKYKKNKKNNNK